MLRRVYVGRIYSSIAQGLKFEWSIQVTWTWWATANHIRLSKRKYSLLQNTKADRSSICYLFLPLSEQVLYLHETDIIALFWVIIYRILQKLFKIGALKTLAKFTIKHLFQSLFLISLQPTTFLTRDSDTGASLWILQNCQEHYFYRTPLDTIFIEHPCFCIYLWYHKT